MEHGPEITGTLFRNQNSVPKKIRRFVARHYQKWISAKGALTPVASARVRFDRIGEGHQVACAIRLETPAGTLRGYELASNIHQAFDACLKRIEAQLAQMERFSHLYLSPAPAY